MSSTKLFNVLSPSFGSETGRDAIKSERDNVALEVEKTALADALTYPYRVTSDEAEQIANCFPRRYTYPSGQNRDCSHPVLAVLNDYANEDARTQVHRYSSSGFRTLSIGDACHRKIGANHNCLLVNNLREAHRITSNSKAPRDLVAHALAGAPTLHCVKGSHNCDVQASHAFAVHSVYDISMEQIYTTFARHGLESMTVYMYFTTQILADFEDPYGFFAVDFNKNKCTFTMQDESFCYEHDVDTWASWHNTTLIKGRDFCITLEVVRQFGPLRVIKLMRAATIFAPGNLIRSIPLSRYFPGMMCVPDIYWSMKEGFLPLQKECRHFLVPENVVLALMAYANRAGDSGYQFHELAAYASGLRRRIQIGTTTFQDPWYCGSEEYNRVIYSLFILGAIARTDRTQGIKKAFEYLKKHSQDGFFATIAHSINRRFDDIWNNIFHTRSSQEIEVAGSRLWQYKAIPLKDKLTATVYRTSCFNNADVLPVPIYTHDSDFAEEEPEDLQSDGKSIASSDTLQMEPIDPDTFVKQMDELNRANAENPKTQFLGESINVVKDDVISLDSVITEDRLSTIPEVTEDESSFSDDGLSIYSNHLSTFNDASSEISSASSGLIFGFDLPSVSNIPEIVKFLDEQPAKPAVNYVLKEVEYPKRFLPGHCAMQSLYQTCAVNDFIDINTVLISDWIMAGHNLLKDDGACCVDDVNRYIFEGDWQTNDCCSQVIKVLAIAFNLCVTVEVRKNERGKKSFVEFKFGPEEGRKVFLVHQNNHYTAVLPRAGKVEKFDSILDEYSWYGVRVLDLSAAPGYLSRKLLVRGANITSGHYVKGSKMTQGKGLNVYEYNHFNQLYEYVKKNKFEVIINDAAREVNSEDLIDEMNEKFHPLLTKGGMLLTKTFGNPHKLWNLAYKFQEIEMMYASPTCSERYFSLTGFGMNKTTLSRIDHFHSLYDRPGWNRLITSHTLPHCDNKRFADQYFSDPLVKGFKPENIVNISGGGAFEVKCITGYASASKTTNALTQFPRAVFIAPSKALTLRHQKLGVPSFTPHVFFHHKHDRHDTIIVDEAFQFPVEYISLLYQCYSGKNIVLLGDVEQTPMVNYISMKTTSLIDCGIKNSNIDVYKIPKDVARDLNNKHGFNIRTHSTVENGWCIFKGKIEEFAKSSINVICFNNDSAKTLRDMGIKASTITTYTGSREHTVVFYVDSASVMSQITNKPQYIYTGVSRATNQIVVAGDTDVLSRYYNIHGSRLMTFEEISGNYNAHHIRMPDDNQINIIVPNELVCLPASVTSTVAILEQNLMAANDPEGIAFGTYTADIAPVGCGKLSTPTDAVMACDTSARGYRYPLNAKLAKHQISNNTLQAIQTLTKRYGKAYKVRPTSKNKSVTFSSLMQGLSKAIYGNPHCVRKLKFDMRMDVDTIREKYGDYMESLQQKINKNPAAARDLEKNYEFEHEFLNYFNKKQTKFDPKAGFDTSDKVGQGVAATSKRFNVLLAGYARGMLDRVKELLVRNKRKIVLATHDSEAGLNDTYVEFLKEFQDTPKTNYSCNDFSEWDSSFRGPFAQVTTTLLKWMGCPPQLAEEWAAFRENWTMIYRHAFGSTVLNGMEKQFSGNPFTICENTICNMALCFTIFEYKGFLWAFFKGDDSCVRCKSCKITALGKEILAFTGHGLKLHNSPIGEFAGWFLTDEGFFPDVYRYASKFLDKVYLDQNHFNEALASLRERCSAVKNNTQANVGAAMCSLYYQGIFGPGCRTSMDDVLVLFDFLKGSRDLKFEDLVPTVLPLNVF